MRAAILAAPSPTSQAQACGVALACGRREIHLADAAESSRTSAKIGACGTIERL